MTRRIRAAAKAPATDRGIVEHRRPILPEPVTPDPGHLDRINAKAGLLVRREVMAKRRELTAPDREQAARAIAGTDGEADTRKFKAIPADNAGEVYRQTADTHLIDRLARYAQITDRQHEAAQRLLEMCCDAGLLPGGGTPYGRIGHGGEMPDKMAEARASWNRLMMALGSQRADLLTSVCHERHPGVRWLATVQSGLDWLGDRWGMEA